jgi:ABC-type transport system involved in cytochrome bd biosynthesis fused ATPase/permease subunit
MFTPQRFTASTNTTRDAPILIADEAASNLDAESQAMVEEALITESRQRLVLMAVHKLSPQLLREAEWQVDLTRGGPYGEAPELP